MSPRTYAGGCGARLFCGLVSVACAWVLAAAPARGADTVRIGGTGAAVGTMRVLGEAFHASGTKTRVSVLPAIGSGGGVKAVLAGGAEIAVISRPLNSEEAASGARAIQYGRTPFVIATWPGNPVDGVSVSDLVELYGGKRKEWSDGTPVRLVLRPTGDIDTRLLMDLSPALGQAVADAGKRPGMTVADTDSDAADRIERSTGTVGVTSLALALSEKRKVKLLKLGGVEPSVKALAERRYPVEKHVWMVTGPKSGAATQEFIAFVRSAAGRAVLERTGHLVSPAP